ncbi:MAG: helix-turn-helix domain-containing protein [Pseudomonadota bacterium]|nr:helix-turn-helix domain-containing protein [Pseudomonadota bacterium]
MPTALARKPAPRRRAASPEETKARLIEAAGAALLANDGALEMADVAARAGVSAGLAYHYFGSKAGLVSAVVEAFYDRYEAVANERMDPRESWGRRERRRLGRVVDFLYAEPLAPVVLAMLGRTPEVAAVEIARQRAMIELAAHNIENGMRSGEIASEVDPIIAGAAIIGGIRQASALALEHKNRTPRETLADNLWTFIAGAVRLKETKP